MKQIEEFIKNFAESEIRSIAKIKNMYFLADGSILEAKEKISQEPFSMGLFLGEIKNKKFFPSVNLLDMVSKISDKKVFVNEKTAWLFLCKRDIFGKGIVKANSENGFVLVQNERDENLGYGEIVDDLSKKDKVVIKNLFDRGDFLRRERNH